jgi:hypothetical protein
MYSAVTLVAVPAVRGTVLVAGNLFVPWSQTVGRLVS